MPQTRTLGLSSVFSPSATRPTPSTTDSRQEPWTSALQPPVSTSTDSNQRPTTTACSPSLPSSPSSPPDVIVVPELLRPFFGMTYLPVLLTTTTTTTTTTTAQNENDPVKRASQEEAEEEEEVESSSCTNTTASSSSVTTAPLPAVRTALRGWPRSETQQQQQQPRRKLLLRPRAVSDGEQQQQQQVFTPRRRGLWTTTRSSSTATPEVSSLRTQVQELRTQLAQAEAALKQAEGGGRTTTTTWLTSPPRWRRRRRRRQRRRASSHDTGIQPLQDDHDDDDDDDDSFSSSLTHEEPDDQELLLKQALACYFVRSPTGFLSLNTHQPQAYLDQLFALGYRVVTDEGDDSFQPTRETARHLTQQQQQQQQESSNESADSHFWPVQPWHEAPNVESVHVWLGRACHLLGDEAPADGPVIKIRALVPCKPIQLMQLLLDSSQVQRYNKMSLGRQDTLIQQEQDQEGVLTLDVRIARSLTKPKLLPKAIEVCAVWVTRALPGTGAFLLVNRSVWETEAGPAQQLPDNTNIRSELLLGVTLVRPCPGGCEMTTATHVHSPGVPEMIAKRVAPLTATAVVKDLQAVFVQQQQESSSSS